MYAISTFNLYNSIWVNRNLIVQAWTISDETSSHAQLHSEVMSRGIFCHTLSELVGSNNTILNITKFQVRLPLLNFQTNFKTF